MPPIPTVRPNGAAIRTVRKDWRQLTLTQCAEKAGVAQSAWHYYENEKKTPSLEMLVKIADELKVPVEMICKDDLTAEQIAEARRQVEASPARRAS